MLAVGLPNISIVGAHCEKLTQRTARAQQYGDESESSESRGTLLLHSKFTLHAKYVMPVVTLGIL